MLCCRLRCEPQLCRSIKLHRWVSTKVDKARVTYLEGLISIKVYNPTIFGEFMCNVYYLMRASFEATFMVGILVLQYN